MKIYKYIILLTFLLISVTSQALTIQRPDDDDELVSDSDSIAFVPKTLQEKIDSILSRPHKHTAYRKVTVRGRHHRKRVVKEKTTTESTIDAGCCVYNLSADSVIYEYNADKMMTPASTQKMFVCTAMLEKYGINYSFDTQVGTNGVILIDSLGRKFLKGDIVIHGGTDPMYQNEYTDSIVHAIEHLGVDSIAGRILTYSTPRYHHISLKEEKLAPVVAKALIADSICFSMDEPWGTTSFYSDTKCKHKLVKISTPLEKVMTRMMKRSNNSCAEAVLLSLIPDDDNWDYQRCCDIVRNTVSKVLTRLHDNHTMEEVYSIHDGSGLSHSNKTTAQTQVALLRYIYNKFSLYESLREFLPIAGIDGTLRHRMKDTNAYGNVRAKTGTVNGVQTLCGYLKSYNGDVIAFSILLGRSNNQSLGRHLQDEICEMLVDSDIPKETL